MSITPIVASLVAVLATLLGGWFVTTQVTDRWDQKKKNREMNQAAAHDFERLYGEVVAIWKTWNALSAHTAAFATPEDAKWDCHKRATAAEGQIEALLARLAAERTLTPRDLEMLGGLRQAFKLVRRTIRSDESLGWSDSKVGPYVAFKKLAAAMSVLLATEAPIGSKPTADEAAAAFMKITDNPGEEAWLDYASDLVPLTPDDGSRHDSRGAPQ